jgi:hypothetical protein
VFAFCSWTLATNAALTDWRRKKEYRGVLLLRSSSSEVTHIAFQENCNLLDRKYSKAKARAVG